MAILFTRGTLAQWTASGKVLLDGQQGVVRNGDGTTETKIGNGVDTWNALPRARAEALVQSVSDDVDDLQATSLRKGELAANALDHGAVGDGTTNDATAITSTLTAAAAAKVPAVFPPRRYAIGSAITFPAGVSVRATGAVFVKTANNSTYALTLSEGVSADELALEVAGGASSDAGVQITGSKVSVGHIRVTSLTADQLGPNALLVGNPGGTAISDILLGAVTLSAFRSPLRVAKVDRLALNNLRITNYVTGAYIIDVTNSYFRGARLTGTSPSAVGTAGQNAMLMEAQGADFSCSGVVFEDWIAEEAPEHAFRIGGSLSVRDITFRRCIARKPGNAAGNVATGGCGFKALGVSGSHHKRIVYTDCTVLDSNVNSTGLNNYAAFNIGHCDRVTIANPIVAAETNASSVKYGIIVFSSTGILVANPSISKVTAAPIYIFKDVSDPAPLPVTDVQVLGGSLHTGSTGTACVVIDPVDQAYANIHIMDVVCDAGSNAIRLATPTGAGSYSNVHHRIRYINAPTASASPPVLGPNEQYIDYTGPVYGGFGLPGANGSRYVDTTAGTTRIRKAGAWVTL